MALAEMVRFGRLALTCNPTSVMRKVVSLPTSTLTKSAGSLSSMSIWRRPKSRSLFPIEEEKPRRKAMVLVVERYAGERGYRYVVGRQVEPHRWVERGSISGGS